MKMRDLKYKRVKQIIVEIQAGLDVAASKLNSSLVSLTQKSALRVRCQQTIDPEIFYQIQKKAKRGAFMFSIKKIFWAMAVLVSVSTISGCTNKENDPEPTPEQKAIEEHETLDRSTALTSTNWCRVDDWETFQVVMRVTPSYGQSRMQYLKVTADGKHIVYNFPINFVWEEKKNEDIFPNKFTMSIQKDTALIPTLDGYPEQKRIADEVLPLNPQLAKRDGPFSPPMAMSMKTRSLLTGDVVPRNMYPCSSYSETFNEDGPVRPFMEIVMMISQEMSSFVVEGLDHVAKAMPIVYPIEETPMNAEALADSQWCSWREVAANRLLLRTITISGSQFVENAHSENFNLYPDTESRTKFLEENATHSEAYKMSFSEGRLIGKNTTPVDTQDFPGTEMFTFIKDSIGTPMMVRLEPKAPETTRPSFTDIYFRCDDTRPLAFSTGFQQNLPQILDLQKKAIQP